MAALTITIDNLPAIVCQVPATYAALVAAKTLSCTRVIPVVASVTPMAGPTGGGTMVTITGTGFTGATNVKFGSKAATSYTVASDTQITAKSPSEMSGPVSVTVTTPNGTSVPPN